MFDTLKGWFSDPWILGIIGLIVGLILVLLTGFYPAIFGLR